MGNELEVNHILTSTNERTRKERGKRKKKANRAARRREDTAQVRGQR